MITPWLLAFGQFLSAPAQTHASRARELFYRNRMDSAIPIFEKALARNPRDLGTRVLYLDALRRSQRWEDATREARRNLAFDSLHAPTLSIYADLLNPQFGNPAGNADSSFLLAQKAVRLDPNFPNTWLALWVEAVRRGLPDLEQRSLQAQERLQIWSPATLAYARWLLESCPQGALLITFGDSDTFPLRLLQALHDIRPDVTVLNYGLLSLPDYAGTILSPHSARTGLTLEGIRFLDPAPGEYNTLASKIVSYLSLMKRSGDRHLPLAIHSNAATSILEEGHQFGNPLPTGWSNQHPIALLAPSGTDSSLRTDAASTLAHLQRMPSAILNGPATSANDPSPVRRSVDPHFHAINVLSMALDALGTARTQGDSSTVQALVHWMEETQPLFPEPQRRIAMQEMQQILQAGEEKPPLQKPFRP